MPWYEYLSDETIEAIRKMDFAARQEITMSVSNVISNFISENYKEAQSWAYNAVYEFNYFMKQAEKYAHSHLPPDEKGRGEIFWFRRHPYEGYVEFEFNFEGTHEEYLKELRKKMITRMGYIRYYTLHHPIISFDWYYDVIYRRDMENTVYASHRLCVLKNLVDEFIAEAIKPDRKKFLANKPKPSIVYVVREDDEEHHHDKWDDYEE